MSLRYYDAITKRYRQYLDRYSRGSEKLTRRNAGDYFRDLKRELELHAEVEGLHVYRVFQQAEPTRDDAVRALEAHRKIKTLLDELAAAPAYDHKWVPKFQDLQKFVEQHVSTEENEMFRKAEGVMTPQEAEELGVRVEAAKQAISHNAPTTEGGTPERT
jgi:Hemerythrin HHE cation binding domain